MIQYDKSRVTLCVYKLRLCAISVNDCEENHDNDYSRNRGIWSRLAREARDDARYWAIELWLCGGK